MHELRSDYDFVKSGKDFKRLLKWKDTQFNSIDFKIKFIGTHERPLKMGDDYVMNTFMICLLLVTYDQKQEPFTRNQFIEFMKNPEPIHNKKTFVETFKPCNPEDEYARRVILPIVDGQVRCKVNDSWTGTKISENDIVEMIYDKDADVEYRWTPIRVRKDKDFPNFYKVASDIWQSYYRPVTLSIMIGDESIPSIEDEVDVYYNDSASSDSKLRQFHRLCVKNALFEETLGKSEGKRLLDLGSGRGGDISRYFDYDAEVVGVDGSVDNLHNQYSDAYVRLANYVSGVKKRTKSKKKEYDVNKITFLTGDAGKSFKKSDTFDLPNTNGMYKNYVEDKKIFSIDHTFDVATVFFALHYFFIDETTLNTFLENVANNVKVGGYFAGCCYDGQIIHDLFKKNNNMDLCYKDAKGTEILRIQKAYTGEFKDDSSSIGKKINVLVQSIDKLHPEYLVNFKFLQRKMMALGFNHVRIDNFERYYETQMSNRRVVMSKEEQEASFLNKAFIFQKVEIEKITVS